MNTISITVCKNRSENLIKSLPTWLEAEGLSEIHIYDFCSRNPVYVELHINNLLDPKIKVFQTKQDDPFEIAKFLNIALSITKSEHILKLDCDYQIEKDFLNQHRLSRNIFYTGDWKGYDWNDNEKHLSGLLYAKQKNILSVGGYNENIKSWGYEDDDLYSRMEKKGLKRQIIDMDLAYHIPHSNELRGENEEEVWMNAQKNIKLSIAKPWSKDKKRTTGTASHASENLYFFSYGD